MAYYAYCPDCDVGGVVADLDEWFRIFREHPDSHHIAMRKVEAPPRLDDPS